MHPRHQTRRTCRCLQIGCSGAAELHQILGVFGWSFGEYPAQIVVGGEPPPTSIGVEAKLYGTGADSVTANPGPTAQGALTASQRLGVDIGLGRMSREAGDPTDAPGRHCGLQLTWVESGCCGNLCDVAPGGSSHDVGTNAEAQAAVGTSGEHRPRALGRIADELGEVVKVDAGVGSWSDRKLNQAYGMRR